MMVRQIIKTVFPVLLLILQSNGSFGQKYFAENGYVRFFSEAPLEDIEAVNDDGSSIFETGTGRIAFTIPIKNFEFEKKLMQQHFNENYLESDKYPTSTFSGKILGFGDSSEEQELTARGELTIHGVTKEVTIEGQGKMTGDRIMLEASFPVQLEDYNIKIPKVVMFNIAEVVDVTIKFEYFPYESN
jgi:hypothetical protein